MAKCSDNTCYDPVFDGDYFNLDLIGTLDQFMAISDEDENADVSYQLARVYASANFYNITNVINYLKSTLTYIDHEIAKDTEDQYSDLDESDIVDLDKRGVEYVANYREGHKELYAKSCFYLHHILNNCFSKVTEVDTLIAENYRKRAEELGYVLESMEDADYPFSFTFYCDSVERVTDRLRKDLENQV